MRVVHKVSLNVAGLLRIQNMPARLGQQWPPKFWVGRLGGLAEGVPQEPNPEKTSKMGGCGNKAALHDISNRESMLIG